MAECMRDPDISLRANGSKLAGKWAKGLTDSTGQDGFPDGRFVLIRFIRPIRCPSALSHFFQPRLKCSRSKQEFHNVPLMRLQPVELDGRYGPQVQPVDMRRIHQLPLELFVESDCAGHERRADSFQHFVLRAPDHAHKGEHELRIGERRLG